MARNSIQTIKLPDQPGPLHERLAGAVEDLIRERRYRPGDRLPTHRVLAEQAGVAIGTVTKALELLGNRGILRGEVGRGTFVNDVRVPPREGALIDLSVNGPPQVVSEELFREASERALLRSLSLPHGGYADPRGTAEQRRTLGGWLQRTRFAIDEDALVLTVGVQQGVHLAFQDLKPISSLIATEGATYPGAIAAARDLGMQMVPVGHDDEGMLPDRLDEVLGETGAKIVYLTPVCHNPLGFETGEARRRTLLSVIEKHDAWIVEDDIYSVYAAKGAPAFKELAPERTFYATSLSKCLTPLVRVGLLAPPLERRSAIVRALRAHIWGSAPFGIELACALLDLDADKAAASTLRAEAKARVDLAKRVLLMDSVPMPGGAAHLWLPMEPVKAEKFARLAGERGVRLTPPDSSFVGGECAGGVRLSIMATTTREDLEQALRIVAALRENSEEMVV